VAQVFISLRRLDRRASRIALVAAVAALLALGIETYVFTIAYPGFGRVGEREFADLHAFHANRITYSIGPALIVAFGANVLVAIGSAARHERGLGIAAALAGGFVLAWTAFVQVPNHGRLARGYDRQTLAALARAEWPRALATVVQAACDVALLARRTGS